MTHGSPGTQQRQSRRSFPGFQPAQRHSRTRLAQRAQHLVRLQPGEPPPMRWARSSGAAPYPASEARNNSAARARASCRRRGAEGLTAPLTLTTRAKISARNFGLRESAVRRASACAPRTHGAILPSWQGRPPCWRTDPLLRRRQVCGAPRLRATDHRGLLGASSRVPRHRVNHTAKRTFISSRFSLHHRQSFGSARRMFSGLLGMCGRMSTPVAW